MTLLVRLPLPLLEAMLLADARLPWRFLHTTPSQPLAATGRLAVVPQTYRRKLHRGKMNAS